MSDNVSLSCLQISRRQVLQTVGSLTLLGGATIGASTTAAADPGNERWDVRLDAGTTSPTLVDGTIFVGSGLSLYAIDAETREQQWAFETGGHVNSSPTVVDETVFIGSSDKKLYAVDAATGDQQWVFETGGRIASSPAVVDETVFVGSTDYNLYALDAQTGDHQWDFYTDGSVVSSPTVADSTVFVGSNSNYLYAVDVETGDQEWDFETNGSVQSSPTVTDGVVVVGSNDGKLYSIDTKRGVEQWVFETGNKIHSSPTVADGTIFVGTGWLSGFETRSLYAVDLETGTEQWVFETGGSVSSSPTVADGTVFVGSGDDNLYAVDAETGGQQWVFETGSPFRSSPIVVNGTVFIGGSSSLFAIDAGVTGSSEGSRVKLGTLNHHNNWKYSDQSIKPFDINVVNTTIKSGENKLIDVELTNNRGETVEDIEGKLFADDPLSSSDNEIYTGSLDPGETTTVTVNISAVDGATSKDYPVSMDLRYTNSNGDSKLDSHQMTLSVITPEQNSDQSGSSGIIEENHTPILIWGLGTLGAGVYVWRYSQSADSAANKTNTSETDTASQSIADSTAEDTTVEASKLQEQATESIERAERAAEYADYEMARDSYEEAIALLKKAAATADPDTEADVKTKLEETQTALKTIITCQEQRDSLASTLQAAERSFKEAIARYVAGNQTVARIRFRQARDTFEDAQQAIEDTDLEVLPQPIEVSFEAEATIQSTALEGFALLDDSTLDTLSATGIESISELEVNTDQLQPARVTELDEIDEITEREVGILTVLSWWYEAESREFASEAEISQRYEQADYGYNQSI